MICLGDPRDSRATGVLRLLSVLLTNAYDLEEKQRILKDEFDIVATESLRKGMKSVCNLGEGVLEKGMDLVSQLYGKLLSDGRMEDLKKATNDKGFRESLMEEYGISMTF